MNEFDEDKLQALVWLARDRATDDDTRQRCLSEIRNMCGPEYVAELTSLEALDALEDIRKIATTAKDPDVRRQAEQALEQAEWARVGK